MIAWVLGGWGRVQREGLQRLMWKLLGGMDTFTVSTVVMTLWSVYAHQNSLNCVP